MLNICAYNTYMDNKGLHITSCDYILYICSIEGESPLKHSKRINTWHLNIASALTGKYG